MFRRRRKVYVDDLDRPHDVAFFLGFLLLLALVIGGVYGTGWLVTHDKVPRGSSVAGVDIGGRSVNDAERMVDRQVGGRLRRPMPVRVGGRTLRLVADDFGARLDAAATVERTLRGADYEPAHMWAVLTGGDAVAPVVRIDRDRLEVGLQRLARRLDRAPVPYRVEFRAGQPVLTRGRPGVTIDSSGLLAAFRALARADQVRPVTLPVRRIPPAVSWGRASRFADTVATRAIARPVTLVLRGHRAVVEPDVLAHTLRSIVRGHRLRLVGDGAALLRRQPSLRTLAGEPVDARIVVRRGRPVVRRGRAGLSATPEQWGQALARAAQSRKRRAVVRPTRVPPAVTARDLRSLHLDRVVASASIRIPSNLRGSLVSRLAARASGVIVRPGRPVQLAARLDAGAVTDEADLVASAVFDAALRAGLDVPSWRATRHALLPAPDGRRVHVGMPGPDLSLATRAGRGAYVRAYASRGRVHVEIWGRPTWRTRIDTGPHAFVRQARTVTSAARRCRPRPAIDGYRVILRRTRAGGGRRLTDSFVSVYRAQTGVRCAPPVR